MRSDRLVIILEAIIVLLYALFLAVPRVYPAVATDTSPSGGTATLAWLALPVQLSRHGVSLEYATFAVTIGGLVVAVIAALLSILARRRGSAPLWAAGSWLFGASVALLMPVWIAVGFLGALLLVITVRSRLVRLRPMPLLRSVLCELWPLGYAVGFAIVAWRYNPQLLLQSLLIAFGASLVTRAMLPAAAQTQIGGSQTA